MFMVEHCNDKIDIAINNQNQMNNSYYIQLNQSHLQFDYNFTCSPNTSEYRDYYNRFSILVYPDHSQPHLMDIYK